MFPTGGGISSWERIASASLAGASESNKAAPMIQRDASRLGAARRGAARVCR